MMKLGDYESCIALSCLIFIDIGGLTLDIRLVVKDNPSVVIILNISVTFFSRLAAFMKPYAFNSGIFPLDYVITLIGNTLTSLR